MKIFPFSLLLPAVVLALRAAAAGPDAAPAPAAAPARDTLYQTAPIDALLAGVFDGAVPLGALRVHGDFGLGTFNGLDGEMILLDGAFWQATADGQVRTPDDAARTPFAAVTFFDRDLALAGVPAGSLAILQKELDARLPSPNLFYAFRADGVFARVKCRSVPRQQPPYPLMTVAAKQQAVFEFANVRGTLLGFRCPAFCRGLNVPGYHFHFLSDDRRHGGHVLELQAEPLQLWCDPTADFSLRLPEDPVFLRTDLTADREVELRKIEK